MSLNPGRKAKGINLLDFPIFPNKFIVKQHIPTTLENLGYKRVNDSTHETPVLKFKHNKNTKLGLTNFKNIKSNVENTKVFPNGRIQPQPRFNSAREDTFDADYMMPSRVREVLESEGLENNVITGAIGKSEAKHEETHRKLVEERVTLLPRDFLRHSSYTTPNDNDKINGLRVSGPSSWLPFDNANVGRAFVDDRPREYPARWPAYNNVNLDLEDNRLESDRKKWLYEQSEEQLFFSKKIKCPRIVLISSKVRKCETLPYLCHEDVLPIIYFCSILSSDISLETSFQDVANDMSGDRVGQEWIELFLIVEFAQVTDFDEWSLTDILESINKKLQEYRKYCKARSLLLYCQGGPGYIYLLRNYAITPQKLQKPSYRGVIEFWKSIGALLSKLRPAEAAIHILGFRLLDDEQGHKLLPMLQGIMYPNLVRVEVPEDEKESGRAVVSQYFQYFKYKLWKSQQNMGGENEDDIDNIGLPVKPGEVTLTLSL